LRTKAAKRGVDLKALALSRPQEAQVRGPRPTIVLVLLDYGIESAFDGLGLGFCSQNFLSLFELCPIPDQVLVAALACSFTHVDHLMYIPLLFMYINEKRQKCFPIEHKCSLSFIDRLSPDLFWWLYESRRSTVNLLTNALRAGRPIPTRGIWKSGLEQ
jgi:hypothetical protein